MLNPEIEKRYCQSCGMPLRFDVEEYLGTNADDSRSDEYCYYCLNKGEYTVDIPMHEMVDIWVKYTNKYNEYSGTSYSPRELRTVLNKRLPVLKRWKQKQETGNIHYEIVSKIKDYINHHLFDSLDVNLFVEMSCISKFHFRKVFKTVTGENISGYIQRLRLEHIAHLLIATDLTLEQIISKTNYQTKFSLAKAFKKHFGITSSEYRKRYRLYNPVYISEESVPEIRNLNQLKVLYIEVGNAYQNKDKYRSRWNKLFHYAAQYGLNNRENRFISVSLDDPLITPLKQCRFYLGVIVSQDIKPEEKLSIVDIPKGKYAVFRHKGSYASLNKLYRYIYENWLPDSKYYAKNTLSFEMYMNSPRTTKLSDLETDVYIPVEKKEI